ncbi:MAG: DUF1934 domain-containing protein [Clostridia bacterium]|nr:DUF1934 domain-containing protein [Clostridia bacterium]
MKDVIINIKGTQGLGDEKTVLELSSEGTLSLEGENFVLSYFEDTIVDGAKINTTLTAAKDGGITLERKGDLSSKLLIEEGVRNNCFYTVPEGSLTLGIFGKEVTASLTESGGDIKMVYTIDANMKLISENTVEIKIRER